MQCRVSHEAGDAGCCTLACTHLCNAGGSGALKQIEQDALLWWMPPMAHLAAVNEPSSCSHD